MLIAAQFEYIPGKVIEKQDDDIIYNVTFPMECAAFCINEQRFVCNSFDFCSNECRLSRAHIGDGSAVVVDSTTCDHFSSKCSCSQLLIFNPFTKTNEPRHVISKHVAF